MSALLQGVITGSIGGYLEASDGSGFYVKVKSGIPNGVQLNMNRQPGTFTVTVPKEAFVASGPGQSIEFHVVGYVDCNNPAMAPQQQQQYGQQPQQQKKPRIYDDVKFVCTKMVPVEVNGKKTA